MISGSWKCRCGEPLVIRPGLDIGKMYLGEPGLVAAHVTCEGDGCLTPHCVIPLPFMAGELDRMGLYILAEDLDPEPCVWAAAAKVGADIRSVGGYEHVRARFGDARDLKGVVLTPDDPDPLGDLVRQIWSEEFDRELAALLTA